MVFFYVIVCEGREGEVLLDLVTRTRLGWFPGPGISVFFFLSPLF